MPVSAGVRGRESITPKSVTLEALDHDIHRSSFTPNVALRLHRHQLIKLSLGEMFITPSLIASFSRHLPFVRELCKIIKELVDVPPNLMKYTNGGTDQRNTLESVKVVSICLFKELDLDFVIVARCTPGHSYMKPAERFMSILDLGLQNVATERAPCDDEPIERKVKNAIAWRRYENLWKSICS